MTSPLRRPLVQRCSWWAGAAGFFWIAGFNVAHAAEPVSTRSLVNAVKIADTATWRKLVGETSIAERDAVGNTALHFAALNHDLPAVEALLTAGADANAKNNANATPLLYGAGHLEIVRVLLARGADASATSSLGGTPLATAAAQPNSAAVVKVLLDAGADLPAGQGRQVSAALNRAIFSGDRQTIELLLARGAPVDVTSRNNPLQSAVAVGDLATVRDLLERGAGVNHDNGFTGHALNFALYAAQPEIARLLIDRGASVNLRSPRGHGTPPMVFAAYNQDGDPSVAQALLAAQADVNATSDSGATALSYALRSGNDTPLVRFLRSVGAKEPPPVRVKAIPNRPVPSDIGARLALVKTRVQPAIDLLQKTSTAFVMNAFVRRANCITCHQQDVPALAFEMARARGLRVDDDALGRQLDAHARNWDRRVESARQMVGEPTPDPANALGHRFLALKATRYARDDQTDAMVHYLIRSQRADGSWFSYEHRPPMEDGVLVATAWATLGLRDFAPPGREAEAANGLARARRWLASQRPRRPNEAIFQLLGLGWAGESAARLRPYVDGLVQTQRADGGWAQLPGLASDAWATGTALYALHDAGKMAVTDAAYQRGVAFLLRTQFEDGSWWVRSRAWPFQPHFDAEFPHGKDQWISAAATAWASAALLFTLEPSPARSAAPTAQELIATFRASSGVAQAPSVAVVRSAAPAVAAATPATIDFTRNIQPLFERSCIGCHGGEKPRAALTFASRDALLRGGASGEPAIVPGKPASSVLLQYVAGKIEDLEMPPLDRREKYPALSDVEIEQVRQWIAAGALW